MTHPTLHLRGPNLILTFPPAGSEAREHTIAIPLARCGIECNSLGNPLPTQRGWHALLDILRERERDAYTPTIATKAAPNFYQIEQALLAKAKPTLYDTVGKPVAGQVKVDPASILEALRKIGL